MRGITLTPYLPVGRQVKYGAGSQSFLPAEAGPIEGEEVLDDTFRNTL